jgi:hypothetical protein
MDAKPTYGPIQELGRIMIQGNANGRSSTPDSPESAGFFEAKKNIQAKTAPARNRNKPPAAIPAFENLMIGFIIFGPVG